VGMLNILLGDTKYLAYTVELKQYLGKFLFTRSLFPIRIGAAELLIKPRSSDLFTIYEIFSDRCYFPKMMEYCRDIRTVVDFGANIGAFSVWASQLFNPSTVIAVEMESACYQQLLKNINANQLNHVIHPMQAAIFNRTGVIVEKKIPGSNFYYVLPSGKGRTVKAISLSEFLKRSQLQRIDLLKIDIEGSEKYLLTPENARLFRERVGYVLLETHSMNDFRCEQAVQYFQGLGFQLVLTPTPYRIDRNFIIDAYNPAIA
jgi:FkbM family methyltransferase